MTENNGKTILIEYAISPMQGSSVGNDPYINSNLRKVEEIKGYLFTMKLHSTSKKSNIQLHSRHAK